MKARMFTLVMVFAGLVACSASSVEGAPAGSARTSQANSRQPDLATALSMFVSSSGRAWAAYDSLQGITWLQSAPSEYAAGFYEKNGRLMLEGFGAAKLPNGKPGVEYATVEGNEGQSGLTLTGSRDQVQGMSVKKFYFSDDYQSVLQQQLGVHGRIAPLASKCSDEGEYGFSSKPAFFQISLPGGNAYVEASLEEGGKYSPGATVFDFTRERPLERMQELNCQVN